MSNSISISNRFIPALIILTCSLEILPLIVNPIKFQQMLFIILVIYELANVCYISFFIIGSNSVGVSHKSAFTYIKHLLNVSIKFTCAGITPYLNFCYDAPLMQIIVCFLLDVI